MLRPAAILSLLLLSGCAQTESPPSPAEAPPAADAVPASPTPATVSAPASDETPAPILLGWSPEQACGFIGKNFGEAIRPYKNDYADEYSCSTPYKNLQEGANLPNNLAFYVSGKHDLATEVKLVLNVNEPAKQSYAKGQLKKFAASIAKAATGAELPASISSAIESGKPISNEAGEYRQEVKRDDWPTGNGYELHYIVVKVGEG